MGYSTKVNRTETEHFDSNHHRIGRSVEMSYGGVHHQNEHGQDVGYSTSASITTSSVDHFDVNHRPIGKSVKSGYDRTNHYNSQDQQIGYSLGSDGDQKHYDISGRPQSFYALFFPESSRAPEPYVN